MSAAEVPVKFDKETLQWSAELPGSGSSSPVIWGDALFITGEDSEKKTVSLVCLDAKSGRSRWSKSLQVGDY
ncbi:PQQ-binding-like beta-propeller repeat protein, partial [bacterium]|nr:PQQ-binding-like beta-propeller repeat protein [bacterium]